MPQIGKKEYLSVVGISKKTLGKECAMKSIWYTDNEAKEIIANAGALGLVLMDYYKAIAMQTKPDMEDSTLADKHLGVGVKSITNTRLKLTKAGWFIRRLDKRKGKEVVIYLVGKVAVSNYLNGVVAVNSPKSTK